jgi:hypothetical protein
VLAEATDQPHLVEAVDGGLRRFGGTARSWRTDRLATVVVPGTRDVQPSFAPLPPTLDDHLSAPPFSLGGQLPEHPH